jgi:hypothetical protein
MYCVGPGIRTDEVDVAVTVFTAAGAVTVIVWPGEATAGAVTVMVRPGEVFDASETVVVITRVVVRRTVVVEGLEFVADVVVASGGPGMVSIEVEIEVEVTVTMVFCTALLDGVDELDSGGRRIVLIDNVVTVNVGPLTVLVTVFAGSTSVVVLVLTSPSWVTETVNVERGASIVE